MVTQHCQPFYLLPALLSFIFYLYIDYRQITKYVLIVIEMIMPVQISLWVLTKS